jgi:hypothetical protein
VDARDDGVRKNRDETVAVTAQNRNLHSINPQVIPLFNFKDIIVMGVF